MGIELADLHCRSAEAGIDQKHIYVVDSCFPPCLLPKTETGVGSS
jgi:hypothetical protein